MAGRLLSMLPWPHLQLWTLTYNLMTIDNSITDDFTP